MFWLKIRYIHPVKHLSDISKYFWRMYFGPSEIQLPHKQQKMDHENHIDTYNPTPTLNAQLLPSINGSLMSLIAKSSQGEIVVWLDSCVKNF